MSPVVCVSVLGWLEVRTRHLATPDITCGTPQNDLSLYAILREPQSKMINQRKKHIETYRNNISIAATVDAPIVAGLHLQGASD